MIIKIKKTFKESPVIFIPAEGFGEFGDGFYTAAINDESGNTRIEIDADTREEATAIRDAIVELLNR